MSKTKREPVSKTLRFEVFKRDKFTCQYCGRKAPDIVLEVDHIIPVSKGGKTIVSNLITACFDCNRGKKDKTIDDNTIIKKQQDQLEQLQERREQIEMMAEWRKELDNLDSDMIDKIADVIQLKMDCSLTDYGRENMKRTIRKFGFDKVLEMTYKSIDQYFDPYCDDVGKSKEKAINYISRLCSWENATSKNPNLYYANYIRKMIKNTFRCINERKMYVLFSNDYICEENFEDLKAIIRSSVNWTDLVEKFENYKENHNEH